MKENHTLQRKASAMPAESVGQALHGRSVPPPAFQLRAGKEQKPSTQSPGTGNGKLPGDLVNGFATSTGHDLSDVHVHQNSEKPAQLGALAYAQGNDIHLGPGQEKHLAHEAAHVVQQREGRVQANTQVGDVPVNDSKGLEQEADAMGAKAVQLKAASAMSSMGEEKNGSSGRLGLANAPVQCVRSHNEIVDLAVTIFKAYDGLGTDEKTILAALKSLKQDANDISSLKERFMELYERSLTVVLKEELSAAGYMQATEALTPAGEANDLLVFPWMGTVYGSEEVVLSKDAEGQVPIGNVPNGTEVRVKGRVGNAYQVEATLEAGNKQDGYMPVSNISSTISALNRTVSAVNEDMQELWDKSFNEDKSKATEHGGALVGKGPKVGIANKLVGKEGEIHLRHQTKKGERLTGDVHTHPYPKKSHINHDGMGFSGNDISNLRFHRIQGFQRFVEAGSTRFALVITNKALAEKFFDENDNKKIKAKYETAIRASSGTMQEQVIEAVKAVIGPQGSNGISFYATTDKAKLKFDQL